MLQEVTVSRSSSPIDAAETRTTLTRRERENTVGIRPCRPRRRQAEGPGNRRHAEPRRGPGTALPTQEEPRVLDLRPEPVTLMTAREVGAYLQLPPKSVYELVGSLAFKLGPRRLRWRREDLDRWLGQRKTS